MKRLLVVLVVLVGLAMLSPAPPVNAQARKQDSLVLGGKSGKLARKVIIKNADAKIWAGPDGSGGEPAEAFAIYFQLYAADDQVEKNGYYRVGTSNGKPLGWVKKDDVLEWDSRFLLKPEAPTTDAAFQIFIKKNSSDADPRSDEDLTKLDEAAKLLTIPQGQTVICPILKIPGKNREVAYNVAYFAGEARSSTAPVVREKAELQDLKLEIVFVIDTTGSMEPLVKGVKAIVKDVADLVAKTPKLQGKVRFGLVEYRDAVPGSPDFAARMVSKLTENLDDFQKTIKGLDVGGGGDLPEDVLAGLKMGILDSGWEETTSSKHIILVGDASAHTEGQQNTTGLSIQRVIELGRKRKTGQGGEGGKQLAAINFHAILARAPGDDEEARKDFLLAQEQFSQVSKNNGDFQGVYHLLEKADDAEQQAKTVEKVVAGIKDAFDILNKVTASGARSVAAAEVKSAFAKSIYQIIKSNAKEELSPVKSGWASERDGKGKVVARKHVLVLKKELVRLQSSLDFLHTQFATRVDPEERKDIDALLTTLKQAGSSTGAGQSVNDADAKLAAFISDLPLKSDVLRLSVRDLAGYNERNFKDWLGKLDETRKTAALLNRDSSWYAIRKDGKVLDEYTFIRLDQLP